MEVKLEFTLTNGKILTLTEEEAKELKCVLDRFFGAPVCPQYPTVYGPVYDPNLPFPSNPYDPYEDLYKVTCKNTE